MRLWRAGALAKDLEAGRVSEKAKLQYLLAASVLHYLVGQVSILASWRSIATVIYYSAVLLVILGGVILCYNANQRGYRKAFVERYVCLSVPTCIQVYVLGYLALIMVVVVLRFTEPGARSLSEHVEQVAWSVISFLIVIAFFWLLRRHIAVAAGAPAA